MAERNETIEAVFAEFKRELQAMANKANETLVESLSEFKATMERMECTGKLTTIKSRILVLQILFNNSRLVNRDVSRRSPDCGCSRHRCDCRRTCWLLRLQEVQRSVRSR